MHLRAEGVKSREKSKGYSRNNFRVAAIHV